MQSNNELSYTSSQNIRIHRKPVFKLLYIAVWMLIACISFFLCTSFRASLPIYIGSIIILAILCAIVGRILVRPHVKEVPDVTTSWRFDDVYLYITYRPKKRCLGKDFSFQGVSSCSADNVYSMTIPIPAMYKIVFSYDMSLVCIIADLLDDHGYAHPARYSVHCDEQSMDQLYHFLREKLYCEVVSLALPAFTEFYRNEFAKLC